MTSGIPTDGAGKLNFNQFAQNQPQISGKIKLATMIGKVEVFSDVTLSPKETQTLQKIVQQKLEQSDLSQLDKSLNLRGVAKRADGSAFNFSVRVTPSQVDDKTSALARRHQIVPTKRTFRADKAKELPKAKMFKGSKTANRLFKKNGIEFLMNKWDTIRNPSRLDQQLKITYSSDSPERKYESAKDLDSKIKQLETAIAKTRLAIKSASPKEKEALINQRDLLVGAKESYLVVQAQWKSEEAELHKELAELEGEVGSNQPTKPKESVDKTEVKVDPSIGRVFKPSELQSMIHQARAQTSKTNEADSMATVQQKTENPTKEKSLLQKAKDNFEKNHHAILKIKTKLSKNPGKLESKKLRGQLQQFMDAQDKNYRIIQAGYTYNIGQANIKLGQAIRNEDPASADELQAYIVKQSKEQNAFMKAYSSYSPLK